MGAHTSTNTETFPESVKDQSRINQDPLGDPFLNNALAIKTPFVEKGITWKSRITIRSVKITIKHPGIYGKITADCPQPV